MQGHGQAERTAPHPNLALKQHHSSNDHNGVEFFKLLIHKMMTWWRVYVDLLFYGLIKCLDIWMAGRC